jgi:hypothetical protein
VIRRLRSLCARILSRIVPATAQGKQFGATPLVRRRVVVTVERETISILVAGQPGVSGMACGKGGPAPPCPDLPPPVLSTVTPAVESKFKSPAGTVGRKSGGGKS